MQQIQDESDKAPHRDRLTSHSSGTYRDVCCATTMAYASGDWSIPKLVAELQTRVLTQRPTAKRAARPITVSSLHNILRNRYYIGIVTWRGVEYPGKHIPLTDAATFERTQDVRDSHRRSGERSYRRKHHLAGSLCCGRCGSKLIYAISTGKLGVALSRLALPRSSQGEERLQSPLPRRIQRRIGGSRSLASPDAADGGNSGDLVGTTRRLDDPHFPRRIGTSQTHIASRCGEA